MNPIAASDLILAWRAASVDAGAPPAAIGEHLLDRYGNRMVVIATRTNAEGDWLLHLQDAERPGHLAWATHVRPSAGGRRLVSPDDAWLRHPDAISGIDGAMIGTAYAEGADLSSAEVVRLGQAVWTGRRDEPAVAWRISGIFHDWLTLVGADGTSVVRAARDVRTSADARGAFATPADVETRLAALAGEHQAAATDAAARVQTAGAAFAADGANLTNWRAILALARSTREIWRAVDWLSERYRIEEQELTWSAVWGDRTVDIALHTYSGHATITWDGVQTGADVDQIVAQHPDDASAWTAIFRACADRQAALAKERQRQLMDTWKRWASADLPPAAATIHAAIGKRPADLSAAVAQVQAAIAAATEERRLAANAHARALLAGSIPFAERTADLVEDADRDLREAIEALSLTWHVRIFADGTAGAYLLSDDALDRSARGTISNTGYTSMCGSQDDEPGTPDAILDRLHAEYLAERAKRPNPLAASRKTYAAWYKNLSKEDRRLAGVPAVPGVADDPEALAASGRCAIEVAHMREALATIDAGRIQVDRVDAGSTYAEVTAWLDLPGQRVTTPREPQLRDELQRIASILRSRIERTWTLTVDGREVTIEELVRGQRAHDRDAYGYAHHCDVLRVNRRYFWLNERVLARSPDRDSQVRDIAAILGGTEDEALLNAWGERRTPEDAGVAGDDAGEHMVDAEEDPEDGGDVEAQAAPPRASKRRRVEAGDDRRGRPGKATPPASRPVQTSFLDEIPARSQTNDKPMQLTWF